MKKNTGAINKVARYRKQGLTFREIAKLLGANINQVYRWHRHALTDGVYSSPVAKRG